MKTIKLVLIFIIFSSLVLAGCTTLPCKSKLYGSNGECCATVCSKECSNGYVEGTCHCECVNNGDDNTVDDLDDTETEDELNLDELFGDASDIEPPVIPN